jgi:hypothetical protein
MIKCEGGCHCGQVRFEIELPEAVTVDRCNCSICEKSGYLHLIVPAEQFRLLSGEDELVEYRFNSGIARHLFCGKCGIKSFYVPRSHPDAYSVNFRCVQTPKQVSVTFQSFDGKNWERNVEKIAGARNDAG